MISETQLQTFIDSHTYDLRETGNGRWIDQKCTPDVISFIADCIIQFINDANTPNSFTKDALWHYDYSEEFVTSFFSKPSTNNTQTTHEYDKFFAQPLKLLAAADILNETQSGRKNLYSIKNFDVLEYISINDRAALTFLFSYCEKVLTDSGINPLFESFFLAQDKDSFNDLKEGYETFIRQYTEINGIDEPRRIFTKVINPLAFKKRKLGTRRGRLSTSIILYPELMYNRENFRDLYASKPKDVTRVEWETNHPRDTNPNFYKYESNRAKKFVRTYNQTFNSGLSEVTSENDTAPATQIHHIFPEHAFHEIAMYHENLIALTPNQHVTKAHPLNDTRRIDKNYQIKLLLSKAETINEYALRSPDGDLYSFYRLVEVINIGLDKDYDTENNDYNSVIQIITSLNS